MKLKVIDRILLALYSALGVIALIVLCMCVLRPEIYGPSLSEALIGLCGDTVGKAAGCALIVVLIAGQIHLMIAACKREERGPKGSVSVQNTENGEVRVSVQAMEALVRRAIGRQEGVLDVKSKIVTHDDSVTVHIDMTLAVDALIPNITMTMQRRVKRYIEETSGIAVREVLVLVNEVRDGEPSAIPAPDESTLKKAEPEGAPEKNAERFASDQTENHAEAGFESAESNDEARDGAGSVDGKGDAEVIEITVDDITDAGTDERNPE